MLLSVANFKKQTAEGKNVHFLIYLALRSIMLSAYNIKTETDPLPKNLVYLKLERWCANSLRSQ